MVPIVFVHEHEHVHENDKALKADRLKAVVLTLNWDNKQGVGGLLLPVRDRGSVLGLPFTHIF